MEGRFALKNPASSVVCLHPRLRWLSRCIVSMGGKVGPWSVDDVIWIFNIKLNCGIPTSNRHRSVHKHVWQCFNPTCWWRSSKLSSTWRSTGVRHWSPLWSCQIAWAFALWEIPNKKTKSRTSSKKKRKPGKALCRKYRDGRGRVRFQGTKALKLSQTFGSYLSKFWQQVVQRVKEFLYFTNAFFRCLV